MNTYRLMLPVLLCTALASCTVMEDRGPCPCVLDIHLGNSRMITDRLVLSGWSEDSGRLFLDKFDPGRYDGSYPRKVDRGFLHLSAYCGNESMTLRGDKLIIPEGKPCDRVWAYRGATIDATGESAEDHLVLYRQHAVVHVKVELPDDITGVVTLKAKGTSDGFDISTLEPSPGAFSCLATPEGGMNYSVCVPRQRDDSLEMDVLLDGKLFRTVRAGELIAGSGYSWSSADLEDIYLTIKLFTPCNIYVVVNDWDTEVKTFTY